VHRSASILQHVVIASTLAAARAHWSTVRAALVAVPTHLVAALYISLGSKESRNLGNLATASSSEQRFPGNA
jgi:hypothetical protein